MPTRRNLARMDEVPSGPDGTDPFEPEPFERDELDDAETVASIDAWEAAPDEDTERLLPSRLVSWSRSSVLGLVISGAGLGIQEVYQPRDERTIVVEVDDAGEPHDLPIELFLDPDDPSGSLCIVHREPRPPVV